MAKASPKARSRRWLKNEGDEITTDEPLLEVSTDKVDTEIPAPATGVLLRILAHEDETVAVGAELAVIGEANEAPLRAGSDSDDGAASAADAAPAAAAPVAEEAVAAARAAQRLPRPRPSNQPRQPLRPLPPPLAALVAEQARLSCCLRSVRASPKAR